MHWDYNYTKSSLKSLTTIMCQELRNITIAYYASLGVKTTEIQQLLKKNFGISITIAYYASLGVKTTEIQQLLKKKTLEYH